MTIEQVRLADIRRDDELQARVETRQDVVEEYAERLAEGVVMPPPVLFRDDVGALWTGDGNHTVEGHLIRATAQGALDTYMIEADVRSGTREAALLFAAGANATHGLRRSRADKRRAVLIVLGHTSCVAWGDREIARHCHVSHPFVARVRAERDARLHELRDEGPDVEEEEEEDENGEDDGVPEVVTLPPDLDLDVETDPGDGEDISPRVEPQDAPESAADPEDVQQSVETELSSTPQGPTVWERLRTSGVDGVCNTAVTTVLTPGTPEWAERAPSYLSKSAHVILRELRSLPQLCADLVEHRIWEAGPDVRPDWDSFCRDVVHVEPEFVRALLDLHKTYIAAKTSAPAASAGDSSDGGTTADEQIDGGDDGASGAGRLVRHHGCEPERKAAGQ